LRLLDKEVRIIKTLADEIFEDAQVYLFGSRVDDTKEGGDIDLYVVSSTKENLFQKKLLFQTKLEDLLYKPVDVVVATDAKREIEQEALRGILLLRKKDYVRS